MVQTIYGRFFFFILLGYIDDKIVSFLYVRLSLFEWIQLFRFRHSFNLFLLDSASNVGNREIVEPWEQVFVANFIKFPLALDVYVNILQL